MSLKLLNSQEDCVERPEPLLVNSTTQQRIWKNTGCFDLHKKLPLIKIECRPKENKKMMRKYYGRKILYITKPQELGSALISRAKLLRYVEIEENKINPNRWKYKGNIVNFGTIIKFRGDSYEDLGTPSFKKMIRYCEKAEIMIWSHLNLRLLKNMLLLKKLRVELSSMSKIDFLGRFVRNIGKLETLKVDYSDIKDFDTIKHWWVKQKPPIYNPMPKKYNSGFFSSLHKLHHLKKMKFYTEERTFRKMDLERDLDKFYSQPLSFNLWIEIRAGHGVSGARGNSNINKVLHAAEYLSLEDDRDDETQAESKERTKKKEALDKKNNVEIYVPCFEDNGISIRLYLDSDSENDEDASGPVSFFTSPLLKTFCEIKEKCHSLQYLSLYLSTLEFPEIQEGGFLQESPSSRENVNLAVEEISVFEKLKQVEIVTTPNDLKKISLNKILSNKSLEVIRLQFGQKLRGVPSTEWDDCLVTATANQLKELSMRFARIAEISLFGINLFNYIQRLVRLEVVELVNKNLEVVTFDYLYGLVTNLLDRKNMRKILICTKVMNNVYSEKSLRDKFKDMLKEVSQDWETRVKVLKDWQLEEIFVGKFSGYDFEYLLFNRECKIVEKLFWSQKEMESLLGEKIELASLYQKVFDLFKAQETSLGGK